MKLAALFSGGKDSTFALYQAMKEEHEIKYLITISPRRQDSWMFHHPCIKLTKLQSKILGIKQIFREIEGEKEKELEDLKKVLEYVRDDVDGVISGTVSSSYQKSRIDKICEQLKLKNITPLWHRDPKELWKEEIQSGFEIIITAVSTDGLDRTWLGKRIDMTNLAKLKQLSEKFGFNISGEGGEFESLVCDCPIFKKKIKILDFDSIWDNKTNSGYLEIVKVKLIPK